MEEDNKRQRLPPLPSNYVTILQLKERWIKDHKRKRKQNKDQQLEQKSEPEPNPQEQREIRDVLEKSAVAACLASCETADMKIETEELKIAKRKWWRKKLKNGKSKGRAQAATIAVEDEAEVAGGEEIVPQTKEASLKSRNERRLRKLSTDGGREREKNGSKRKPEGAVCLFSYQITDKKEKTWKSKKNQRKKEWKVEKRDDEEVAKGEAHAPKTTDEKEGDVCLVSCQFTDKKESTWKSKKNQGKLEWRKVKEKKDDEEVAGCEVHVPKTSDEKELMAKSGNAVVTDQMVEIEGRMKNGMSIKVGRERGNDALVRPNNGDHYRGGYQRFDNGHLCKERNLRNARMIWVKK